MSDHADKDWLHYPATSAVAWIVGGCAAGALWMLMIIFVGGM